VKGSQEGTLSKFELGQVVATPGALEALARNGQMALQFISRHVQGEWGELSDDDAELDKLRVDGGLPEEEVVDVPF